MKDTVLKLELTVAEVDAILSILAERPFKDVFQIIEKIRTQAKPQTDLI